MKLFIPIIEGTIRPKRKSITVARAIFKIASQMEEVETLLVDPIDFNFPYDGNDPESKDPKFTEITARADGFMIVVPEYNHSFPGSLKTMLDSEYKNYNHKAVAFAGVSDGQWGGVRAVEALLHPVRDMGLVAISKSLYFPNVPSQFDENGELKDPKIEERIYKILNELIWMTKVLKYGRENLK